MFFLQSYWANKVPKVHCQNDLELWPSDQESMGNLRVAVQQVPRWQQSQNLAKIFKPYKWAYDVIDVWATRWWTYVLAHLSRRLTWAIVIVHRPSSVRPSVRRRPSSSVNFHIFDFSSETAERNSTKLDRKQDLNTLYQVCVFRADQKNKMAALASDGLRHFRLLLWNHWTEFNKTWQEARSKRPLPSLCFSGRSEKQDGRPGFWLAKTFSTSPLKPLNRIQWNLIGSKISTPSTKFVFFGPIGKNKMAALASDWLRHFDFSCETVKGIRWNLIGSKISTPSTKFVFFRWFGKTKWPPWPLICWGIFNFSSETAE